MRVRVALLGASLLALAACGTDDGQQPAAANPVNPGQATGATSTVRAVESELGPILVDQSGRTLYAFTKDKDRSSSCDADCIAVWPALSTTVAAGDGANAALIGRTEQAEGEAQARYGEWPLYYYVGDAVAGDVNGQGIDGEWFALSPDGKLIKS